MTYHQFLDFLLVSVLTLLLILFASIASLQFQIAVKKSARKNIEEFRDSLPIFLQELYFTSKNAIALYIRTNDLDAPDNDLVIMEILLKSTFYRSLFDWTFIISCEIGINVMFFYIRHRELGYIPVINLLASLVYFLFFLRISLFGIKLKRGL